MRIATSVTATIQQAQVRDKNDITRNYDRGVGNNSGVFTDREGGDKISRIKEQIKNGSYKIDLLATADRMAQSLLNI